MQEEWTGYTEFLEQGCDAALFVGMHAMAGTQDGNMNHTVSGRDYQRLWFNGTEVGETGINAALCGTWGCPVLLVTGDEASCREGKALLGDGLTTVAVKRAFGSGAARMIPPVRARRLIEEGAKKALADLKAVPPYDPGSPCEIKVEFKRTPPADRLRFHPGVERLDGRTIRVERRHVVGRLEALLLRDLSGCGRLDDPELLDEREEGARERRARPSAPARTSQSICSRSERASSSTRGEVRLLLVQRQQLRRQHVAERRDGQPLRGHLDLLGALEVAVVDRRRPTG